MNNLIMQMFFILLAIFMAYLLGRMHRKDDLDGYMNGWRFNIDQFIRDGLSTIIKPVSDAWHAEQKFKHVRETQVYIENIIAAAHSGMDPRALAEALDIPVEKIMADINRVNYRPAMGVIRAGDLDGIDPGDMPPGRVEIFDPTGPGRIERRDPAGNVIPERNKFFYIHPDTIGVGSKSTGDLEESAQIVNENAIRAESKDPADDYPDPDAMWPDGEAPAVAGADVKVPAAAATRLPDMVGDFYADNSEDLVVPESSDPDGSGTQ